MKFFKVIFLYPISIVYGIVVNIRNTLFDLKIFKSEEFEFPVISVGNITVGGTGKTPTTEYIIRLLQDDYSLAILSRGYKRKTKGFFLADQESTTDSIGDEPYQIQQKFPNITVAVDEKRVRGIKKLRSLDRKIDVIILDDAFQHRSVNPGFSILLIDYTQPFFEDSFLPYGRLRDSPREIYRANIIIITKAPKNIKPIDMRIMATNIKLKAYQSLYFSSLLYTQLRPVFNNSANIINIESFKEKKYTVLLVTGIGNFKPIFEYCENTVFELIHLPYKDHHNYTNKDIKTISEKYKSVKSENKIILTTEKDAGKIKNLSFEDNEVKNNFFYCPIEFEILNNEKEELDKQIINYIKKDKSQYRFLTTKRQY